jgi:hypothetical protein
MTAAPKRSRDVDRHIARLDPSQRAVASALRAFILREAPELHEAVKWGVPAYVGQHLVCSIASHTDHTNLEFYRGASLRAAKGLLEGTGKSLRHVKFYAPEDVPRAGLKPLLRRAVALDRS